MFKGAISIAIVMLVLALFTANAVPYQCNDISPDDCRKEFGTQLDKAFKMKMTEVIKMQMIKVMETLSAIKANLLADSILAKGAAQIINEMKNDFDMLESIIENAFRSVQKDVKTFQPEDTTNIEKFNELIKSLGDLKDLEDDFVTNIMKNYEKVWNEMYSGLRDEDIKMYSQYMELNEEIKTLMIKPQMGQKKLLFRIMMQKLMNFTEIPFMTAMINAICNNCLVEDK